LIEKIFNNTIFTTSVSIATIYALFGDDFRLAFFESSTDLFFNILNIIVFILFGVEIIMACKINTKFFGGFFFWLDTISTLIMILDITWISEILFIN